MKPPKEINYVSVECNLFQNSPMQINVCIIMINIQEHISEGKKIIRDSNLQC